MVKENTMDNYKWKIIRDENGEKINKYFINRDGVVKLRKATSFNFAGIIIKPRYNGRY